MDHQILEVINSFINIEKPIEQSKIDKMFNTEEYKDKFIKWKENFIKNLK